MTREQELISHRNRTALRKKLGIQGQGNKVLHHVDKEMKYNDIERYIQWNEEDVVIMTRGEHTKLHYDEIFTEETKKKMSHPGSVPWCKGLTKETDERLMQMSLKQTGTTRGPISEETREKLKNIEHTEEWKEHCAEGLKEYYKTHEGNALGKHWYNNSSVECYAIECPEGFTKGRLKGALNRANEVREMKRYAELTQTEA